MKKTVIASLLVLMALVLLLPGLSLAAAEAAEGAMEAAGGTSDHMVKFAVAVATGIGRGMGSQHRQARVEGEHAEDRLPEVAERGTGNGVGVVAEQWEDSG